VSENRNAIKKISEVIQKADDSSVLLTVLDAPSFQTIFANKRYGKKHVIAEFSEPARRMQASPLVTMMFKEYYKRADRIIFQTPGAMAVFDSEVQEKGVVIPNPLSENLPKPYFGPRKKTIVNFCRFSEEKNIPLLLKAFSMLHEDFSEIHLTVYGGATTEGEKKCLQECNDLVNDLGLQQSVSFPGFSFNIHEKIMEATMFVSSSDYEGLSNSMIEAMALGLPVVCTDCPAGGASYIIENEVNGLLTPVGDVESLYKAMKRIISDKELALKLSYNAIHVRERLKLGKIADEWMEALDV
jgi:glycosyltransferase involved in cell wall biosynthesis